MRWLAALLVLCSSCSFDAGGGPLAVAFPGLPGEWESALGAPSWRLAWYGADGSRHLADGDAPPFVFEIPLGVAVPVLAYPYWPERGIPPGYARPAGAVAPFDVEGDVVRLDWRGGVRAAFYRELLAAEGPDGTHPRFFDWPRFASLLESDRIAEAAAADPWSIDWSAVAAKTRAAGFDSRRLVPRTASALELILPHAGPWLRASPFAAPPRPDEAGVLLLDAGAETDSLLSASGVVRFSAAAWAWFPSLRLDTP